MNINEINKSTIFSISFKSAVFSSISRKILPICFFILFGIILQVMPYFNWNFTTLPGNLDTLFNRYVMEHGYRWLTGQEPSFWNAPFFYPAPLTLAYSDCHAGNLVFYAMFRFFGFSPDGAIQCWILLQYVLNFLACNWLLRHLGFSTFAACLGSYLYAFGMPVTAQIGHIQLLPRFMIPVAFGLAYSFWKNPNTGQLALLALAVCWQFASSIYLGTLLILFMVVFFVLMGIYDRHRKDWRKLLIGVDREPLYRLLILIVSIAFFQQLFTPYIEVWQTLNLTQPLSIRLLLLPHIKSYLLPGSDCFFWQWLYPLISIESFKNEHSLFAGLAALIATIAAAWALLCVKHRNPLLYAIFISWLILVIFSLQIGDFSIYKLLRQYILGLNSLRSMTRIILILLLCQAIFIAWLADHFLSRKQHIMLALFTVILILEGAVLKTEMYYNKATEQHNINSLAVELAKLPSNVLFIKFPESLEAEMKTNLYAMLAAQQCNNLFTINGYSGHNPPGWFIYGWQAEKNNYHLDLWRKISGKIFYPEDPMAPWRRTLYIIQ